MRVDPLGVLGPTRGQAQRGRWRRSSFGFYVPDWVNAQSPEQRVLEQSVRLPAGGAVTGWGSLRIQGANFFDGLAADRRTRIPVPLAVGPDNHIREDEGVTVSREALEPGELVTFQGIVCTHRLRAAFDAARDAPDVREAVVVIDMVAAPQMVSIKQLRDYVATRQGWRGVRQAREALGLASEDSRSPNETRMRLIWQLDAGFPCPLVNRPGWDRTGRLLGHPDLLDPVAGVVGEFDGADHRGAVRHSKDVGREAGFRNQKLEFFRVMGLDLPMVPLVADRMRSARSRAHWLSAEHRPWTIVPPPGWQPEEPLDAILERRAWQETMDSNSGLGKTVGM